jgi:hypothetical protein
MKSSRLLQLVVAAGAVLPFTGCASIMSGRQANVAIDSYPSNAHVTVHDKQGRAVASVTTPAVVQLKRNDKYFLPAKYTATIEAPGYQTAEVPIQSTLNPWIAGNILAGGVIGLAVDNATGAAWKPKQDKICQSLLPLDPNLPANGNMQSPQLAATTPASPPAVPWAATSPVAAGQASAYPVTQTSQQETGAGAYTARNPVATGGASATRTY